MALVKLGKQVSLACNIGSFSWAFNRVMRYYVQSLGGRETRLVTVTLISFQSIGHTLYTVPNGCALFRKLDFMPA